MLSKPRYKNFKKTWDGVASDEASEEFDDLVVAQGRENLCTVLEDDIVKEGSESMDEERSEDVDMVVHELDGDEGDTPAKSTLIRSSTSVSMPSTRSYPPPQPMRQPGVFSAPVASACGGSAAKLLSESTLAAHDRVHPPAPVAPGPAKFVSGPL